MSDFDPTPDPIDEAYVRAEALLADEAARAARRDRILAAVGREPAAAAASPLAPPRRRAPVWRRGGWLAAACVAGVCLFVVDQIYQPAPFVTRRPPVAPSSVPAQAPLNQAAPIQTAPIQAAPARAAPAQAATLAGASSTQAAPAVSTPPPPPLAKSASAPAAVRVSQASPAAEVRDAQRGTPEVSAPSPAPPPAPVLAQAPRAFPAEPPQSVVVTAERRASERAADSAESSSGGTVDEVVRAQGRSGLKSSRSQSFATIAPQGRLSSFAARTFDQATQLRDAAEAGQTAEVESLLEQGAPVDAPDAEGNTALIKSVQADHPAAAAALSRHGASLDHKNHAGESARDIAAAKEDAALNEALGLAP